MQPELTLEEKVDRIVQAIFGELALTYPTLQFWWDGSAPETEVFSYDHAEHRKVYLLSAALQKSPSAFALLGLEIQNREERGLLTQQGARLGDLFAQAVCKEHGLGESRNFEAAIELYQAAAEQVHVEARNRLGRHFDSKGDCQQAFQWFLLAAEKGHLGSQYQVGVRYLNNLPIDGNHEQGLQWLRQAAERGHTGAQTMLGDCYRTGFRVKRDFRQTAHWYSRAVLEQNDSLAQIYLANLYRRGQGCSADPQLAVHWLHQAAAQGNDAALYALGNRYRDGVGVPQDPELAQSYFSQAQEAIPSLSCDLTHCPP